MATTKSRKRFRELPRPARIAIMVAGAVEVGLFAAAQVDITRRPVELVRGGNKLPWRLVCLLNLVGPAAYFCFGRLRAPAGPARAPETPAAD